MLAVDEDDSLTLVSAVGDDAISAASTYSPPPDAEQTQALLARVLMAANLALEEARIARLGPIQQQTGQTRSHAADDSAFSVLVEHIT